MQTMYKVVHVDFFGVKTSCAIRRGKLLTDYIPHKWTIKRKYGPMVFLTPERAHAFLEQNFLRSPHDWTAYEIWECDAENVNKCDHILPPSDVQDLNNETVRRRMDAVVEGMSPWPTHWAPIGTYIASRVRLIRQIW